MIFDFLKRLTRKRNGNVDCAGTEMVKLPTNYDIDMFSYGGKDAETILMLSIEALGKGEKFFLVPRDVYDGALSESNRYKEFDRKLKRTVELNNIGIAAEKDGRIEDAIKAYEENITIGHTATHSYDRLIVLYKRLKRTDDLKRVIFRKIEVFGESKELIEKLQNLQ